MLGVMRNETQTQSETMLTTTRSKRLQKMQDAIAAGRVILDTYCGYLHVRHYDDETGTAFTGFGYNRQTFMVTLERLESCIN